MKNVCVIVQARLDSSRIEQKMIKPFGNSTLLDIILEKLKKSTIISDNDVYISLCEEELKSIARKYNFNIFNRSKESASVENNMICMFEWWEKLPYTHYVLVSACNPFLTIETIEDFYKIFQTKKNKVMFAVVKRKNYFWNDSKEMITYWGETQTNFNTKFVEDTYEAAHCLYAGNLNDIGKGIYMGNFSKKEVELYIIKNEFETLDIDYPWQFQLYDAYICKNNNYKIEKKNVLVIGGGSIGRRHINNLKKLQKYNVLCKKREYSSEFEKEHKVTVITDYSQINIPIYFIIVCTPTNLHNEGLKYAVDNDIPILMEKPLIDTINFYNTQTLLSNYNNVFMIAYMLRWHKSIQQIKKIIDSLEYGKVLHCHIDFGYDLSKWHPYEDYKISYASNKDMGGGVINTNSHDIDLVHYFFNKPSSMLCKSKNLNILNIDVEEMVDIIFDYVDKTVTVHSDFLQKKYNRTIDIVFENSRLTWNMTTDKIFIDNICVFENNEHISKIYEDELDHFINLIETNKTHHSLDKNYAILNTQIIQELKQLK